MYKVKVSIFIQNVVYSSWYPSWKLIQVFILNLPSNCGPGSSVGIATGYGLDGPRIESRWGARFFAHVQTGPGTDPASWTMGTGSVPGVKRPGRGVDHPPPPSTEVENE
jgi:hypothetical protein